MPEVLVGSIPNYYSRIGVAALTLEGPLHISDPIHIVGNSTDMEQTIESMGIEHSKVDAARAGDEVAIEVSKKV